MSEDDAEYIKPWRPSEADMEALVALLNSPISRAIAEWGNRKEAERQRHDAGPETCPVCGEAFPDAVGYSFEAGVAYANAQPVVARDVIRPKSDIE